jgi:quercetin 2,3-dioxygenase
MSDLMPSADVLECLPGLTTAGSGIAHAEETPSRNSGRLHGVQLWVALPDARRRGAPSFDHYAELPAAALGSARAVVLMGELDGARSPANAYARMVGADIIAGNAGDVRHP